MTEAFETACFGIITYVGTARSCFVNAVQCAKQGDFEAAQEQIRQGDEAFTEGHHIHADLLNLLKCIRKWKNNPVWDVVKSDFTTSQTAFCPVPFCKKQTDQTARTARKILTDLPFLYIITCA